MMPHRIPNQDIKIRRRALVRALSVGVAVPRTDLDGAAWDFVVSDLYRRRVIDYSYEAPGDYRLQLRAGQ